ncbi:hypothetical protein [Dictyobacter formicarum]|uniref:Uncharacterized protein n=1 Tax=Dictyobacter formicarum TaxID=2778368 RepID=A0ABQ3VSZ6_9CHLR|nr:hypothetical protein [Dictyobacter formicarum]GHO88246.1 hypothetical protein KSZ_62520 [Dictyobacter formicarum]
MPKKTSQGDGQPPHRRRPGRPRRTPEQLDIAKERRIPRSQKGRLKFRPGDAHALDIQMQEARNYRHLIAAKVEQLQALVAALDASQDDPGVAMSEQEAALKSFLWTVYADHKHRDHILATFLAIRRARLLAKLEAAGTALEMAASLLAPDEHLFAELRAAVEQQRQEAASMRPPAPTRQDENGEHQTAALLRVTGPTEETVRDQLDAIRAEYQDNPIKRIDHRHIYGDSQAARRQLDAFNAHIKTIRAAISPAIGWFESFYIEKVRLSQEARAYLRKGKDIPPGVDLFEGIIYGPYLKYRWQEESDGAQYTIQMGRIDGRSPQDEEKQERGSEPWPSL